MRSNYRELVESLGTDLSKIDPGWLQECERAGLTPTACADQVRSGSARLRIEPVRRKRAAILSLVLGLISGLIVVSLFLNVTRPTEEADPFLQTDAAELRDLERIRGKKPVPQGERGLASVVEAALRKEDTAFARARDVNASEVFQYGDKWWGQDVTYTRSDGKVIRRRFSIRDGRITGVEKDFSD